MRKVIASAAVTAATFYCVGTGHAADFSSPVVEGPMVYDAAPVASWTGLYVGAHIGYGSGETNIQNTSNDSPVITSEELEDRIEDDLSDGNQGLLWVVDYCDGPDCADLDFLEADDEDDFTPGQGPYLDQDMDVEGMFGGLQLGYNYQMGSFVLGVVGDASVSTMNGRGGNSQNDEDSSGHVQEDIGDGTIFWEPLPQTSFETEINWLATLRAKAGWTPTSNWLLYVHGGLAAGDVEISGHGTLGPYAETNHSDVQVGWTAGIGTEYMFTDRLSLFAEYAYTDLGNTDVGVFSDDGPDRAIETETTFHAVKAGINWRLTN